VYVSPRDVCVLARVTKLIAPLKAILATRFSLPGGVSLPLAARVAQSSGQLLACDELPEEREDHVRFVLSLDQLRILWALGYCRDSRGAPIVSDDGYLMCASPRGPFRYADGVGPAPAIIPGAPPRPPNADVWLPKVGAQEWTAMGTATALAAGAVGAVGTYGTAMMPASVTVPALTMLAAAQGLNHFRNRNEIRQRDEKLHGDSESARVHLAADRSRAAVRESELLSAASEGTVDAFRDGQMAASERTRIGRNVAAHSFGGEYGGGAGLSVPLRTVVSQDMPHPRSHTPLGGSFLTPSRRAEAAFPKLPPQVTQAGEEAFKKIDAEFRRSFEGTFHQELEIFDRLHTQLGVALGLHDDGITTDAVRQKLRDRRITSTTPIEEDPLALHRLFQAIKGGSGAVSSPAPALSTAAAAVDNQMTVRAAHGVIASVARMRSEVTLKAASDALSKMGSLSSHQPASAAVRGLERAGLNIELLDNAWLTEGVASSPRSMEKIEKVFGAPGHRNSPAQRAKRAALDLYSKAYATQISKQTASELRAALATGTSIFADELRKDATAITSNPAAEPDGALLRKARAIASHNEAGGIGADARFDTYLAVAGLRSLADEIASKYSELVAARGSAEAQLTNLKGELAWLARTLRVWSSKVPQSFSAGQDLLDFLPSIVDADEGVVDLVAREHSLLAEGGSGELGDKAVDARAHAASSEELRDTHKKFHAAAVLAASKDLPVGQRYRCDTRKSWGLANSYCLRVVGDDIQMGFDPSQTDCGQDDHAEKLRYPTAETISRAKKEHGGRSFPRQGVKKCSDLNYPTMQSWF
jgi:hypothetical protein